MLQVKERAPDFTLPDKASGGQLSLADLSDGSRVVVVLAPRSSRVDDLQSRVDEAVAGQDRLAQARAFLLAVIGRDVTLFAPSMERVHVVLDSLGEVAKQYDAPSDGICTYFLDADHMIIAAEQSAPRLDDICGLFGRLPGPATAR